MACPQLQIHRELLPNYAIHLRPIAIFSNFKLIVLVLAHNLNVLARHSHGLHFISGFVYIWIMKCTFNCPKPYTCTDDFWMFKCIWQKNLNRICKNLYLCCFIKLLYCTLNQSDNSALFPSLSLFFTASTNCIKYIHSLFYFLSILSSFIVIEGSLATCSSFS